MERKRGLTTAQKIALFSMWVILCVLLFTLPSDKSMGENIFIAIASGLIIIVGINAGQNKINNRRNRRP